MQSYLEFLQLWQSIYHEYSKRSQMHDFQNINPSPAHKPKWKHNLNSGLSTKQMKANLSVCQVETLSQGPLQIHV